MNHARLLFLFLVLLFVPFTLREQSPAIATAKTEVAASRVETIQFESKLIGKILPYKVLLPTDYEQPTQRATRYPVLILLHGFGGNHNDWLSRTKLADYAAPYRLIIVTPQGHNSWYTDSATVASDKYETYIAQELIADVQKRFRTVEAREGRGVAGLSMGGYGALKFGLKHAEKFALAASMSGAVAAASWRSEDDLPQFPVLRQSMLQTFGAANSSTKNANDLFQLVRAYPTDRIASLPFLYLDCGTEDELQLLAPNRALANIFVERKIPHEYRQLPGGHRWNYWDAQIQEVLQLSAKKLSLPLTAAKTAN
jgi:S-formylglutathione hydrolase FrmB